MTDLVLAHKRGKPGFNRLFTLAAKSNVYSRGGRLQITPALDQRMICT
jgi:hypothetical protein